MAESRWDPPQYARYADERGRPFHDLMGRVVSTEPRVVVDLGCGPGSLTLTLAERWPDAHVVGVDHSPQMLTTARAQDPHERVEWVEGDLRTWDPATLDAPADIVVTNAALQWVPGHVALIERWVAALRPGGWFAMQVPDSDDAPSHALMREVAVGHPRAADLAPAVRRLQVEPPEVYLHRLAGLGCDVDVWSTTYLHVLDPEGRVEDPVLEWVRGTALRPVLDVLSDEGEREAFLAAYRMRLREAYPRTSAGVVLPFRRTFAVARRRHER